MTATLKHPQHNGVYKKTSYNRVSIYYDGHLAAWQLTTRESSEGDGRPCCDGGGGSVSLRRTARVETFFYLFFTFFLVNASSTVFS